MRSFSWLFAAKCLSEAPTPFDWMPRTSAAASTPETMGSSERYSKLRPHSGERLMLAPGPSSTATFSIADSTPRASPTRSARSASHDAPRPTAGGKHVAGTLSARPRWSAEPACLRSPCGPSVSITAGMPTRSTALVVQKLPPLVSDAFSSRVRSATVASRVVRVVSVIVTPVPAHL